MFFFSFFLFFYFFHFFFIFFIFSIFFFFIFFIFLLFFYFLFFYFSIIFFIFLLEGKFNFVKVGEFPGTAHFLNAISFSPNGKKVAIGSPDKSIKLFNLSVASSPPAP